MTDNILKTYTKAQLIQAIGRRTDLVAELNAQLSATQKELDILTKSLAKAHMTLRKDKMAKEALGRAVFELCKQD